MVGAFLVLALKIAPLLLDACRMIFAFLLARLPWTLYPKRFRHFHKLCVARNIEFQFNIAFACY